MNYGIYKVKLSIGYAGAEREDEIDVTEEYGEDEWNSMSEFKQDAILTEWMNELLGEYIEMSYWEKK